MDPKPLDLAPTPSQTVGPYLHLGLTDQHAIAWLAGERTSGEAVRLICRVFDGDGLPVPDAMLEVWQANAEGKYNHPEDTQPKPIEPAFRGFGRLPTAEDGSCVFQTIKPGRVPGEGNRMQAPHLNISIFARGLLVRLTTRMYFAGDPANTEDPVLSLVPEARRQTLMAQPDPAARDVWRWDIRLSGDEETVFFEV